MIADAHSDLLLELTFAEDELGEENPLRSRWLPQLERGGVALQVCAIYIDDDEPDRLRAALRQARSFKRALCANRDRAMGVRTRADLDGVGGDGRSRLLLSLEGVGCFGEDGWLIDIFYELGVRMASLTWNERNAFGAGCDHEGGLSALGERLVRRIAQRGMVLDLAHASPRTFADALARGSGAVVASHTACRAVHDHRRNLSDQQLSALAERGGVVGLMPHPLTVDPAQPTLERFLDHIDHAISVMGIEHVGLGGDFLRQIVTTRGEGDYEYEGMRADAALAELPGPEQYPALVGALRERGYAGADLEAILGGNMIRLLRRGLPAD